jgi:hypothetical protein
MSIWNGIPTRVVGKDRASLDDDGDSVGNGDHRLCSDQTDWFGMSTSDSNVP